MKTHIKKRHNKEYYMTIYNTRVLWLLGSEYELNNNEPLLVKYFKKRCKESVGISDNNLDLCLKNFVKNGHADIDEENQTIWPVKSPL